jgi:HEAT repeat protein
VTNRQDIETTLGKLFDAERTVRRLHDELAAKPVDPLLDVLGEAIRTAQREGDEDEASLRLVRIASLLGEHEGPRVVDALIDVLGSEHVEARRAAGEELEALAYDRFKEVALGIERALKRLPKGSPALRELPYVIAEVPEPGVARLLGQFLKHQDPDAVSAAIEALVEIGDPSSAELIEPLVGDARTVELEEDEGGGTSEVTLGELAEEALGLLSPDEEDEEDSAGARS